MKFSFIFFIRRWNFAIGDGKYVSFLITFEACDMIAPSEYITCPCQWRGHTKFAPYHTTKPDSTTQNLIDP